jgi:hypothetical protein
MSIGQNTLLHYSSTPLPDIPVSWFPPGSCYTFPLTRGGSVPTFYAFSGVETAGEQ